MAAVSLDLSELHRLTADLRAADLPMSKVRPVVSKGALNIKSQMVSEASRSRHFRIGPTISYDMTGGASYSEAQIGPVRGGAGSLAGIAYFGGVHGGGGTIPDPQGALDAEAPRFLSALTDLAAKVLW